MENQDLFTKNFDKYFTVQWLLNVAVGLWATAISGSMAWNIVDGKIYLNLSSVVAPLDVEELPSMVHR